MSTANGVAPASLFELDLGQVAWVRDQVTAALNEERERRPTLTVDDEEAMAIPLIKESLKHLNEELVADQKSRLASDVEDAIARRVRADIFGAVTPRSGNSSMLYAGLGAMVVALILTIGGNVLLFGSGAEGEQSIETADDTTTSALADEQDFVAERVEESNSTVDTTTAATSNDGEDDEELTAVPDEDTSGGATTEVETPVYRLANLAYVRSKPSLEADVIHIYDKENGRGISVLGPISNGWYPVRTVSGDGWMFGAFVVPGDEGFVPSIDVSGTTPVIYDPEGNVLHEQSSSGNKLLVIGFYSERYQVITPEGHVGYVYGLDVQPWDWN